MNLYLKYRPQSLDEIIGNREITSALTDYLDDIPNCPQSFMLTGPTGCGKTTIARIITKKLDVIGGDLKEMDTAHFRGIDTIREIRKVCGFKSMEGKARAYILDECHQLSKDAQNTLLKVLEDTPPNVYFILCTTDPQKVLPAVKNRCITFEVHPLLDKQMHSLIRRVVKAEDESLDKKVYEQIILDSLGLPRNALQILDKVLRVKPESRLKAAKKTAEKVSQSIELCRSLLRGDAWRDIAEILQGLRNEEPEGIRRHVLGYCTSVILKGENDSAALIMEQFIEPFFTTGYGGLVFACYSVIYGDAE